MLGSRGIALVLKDQAEEARAGWRVSLRPERTIGRGT